MKKIDNDEIPKYKKKKTKTVKKSSHKHNYIDCLLKDSSDIVVLAKYCSICGKVVNQRFISIRVGNYNRMLSKEETLERYGHLQKFDVQSVFKVKKIDLEME